MLPVVMNTSMCTKPSINTIDVIRFSENMNKENQETLCGITDGSKSELTSN